MKILSCEFNIDTACVELKLTDGTMISIDCTAVENEVADNMYQRSELDWLIYNAPLEYADLILNGDPEKYLKTVYEKFDSEAFYQYLEKFDLDKNRKISTFSKGMKKQMAIICGLCTNTKYLICDETFDGLDPVMRQGIKAIFAKHMEERGLTPIIASHNLRELEDICDTE